MANLKMDQKWPFWPRSEADFGSVERVQLAGPDGTKMGPLWIRSSTVWPILGVPFWLKIGQDEGFEGWDGPKWLFFEPKWTKMSDSEG
jgi:hypothetical protein